MSSNTLKTGKRLRYTYRKIHTSQRAGMQEELTPGSHDKPNILEFVLKELQDSKKNLEKMEENYKTEKKLSQEYLTKGEKYRDIATSFEQHYKSIKEQMKKKIEATLSTTLELLKYYFSTIRLKARQQNKDATKDTPSLDKLMTDTEKNIFNQIQTLRNEFLAKLGSLNNSQEGGTKRTSRDATKKEKVYKKK